MSVYKSITELIGGTPLVQLGTFAQNRGLKANVIAKVEYFNPGGSVKDRIALSMILDAEEKGILRKGGTIIEPTSGNTGVGLAMIAAERGYRMILVMPETMSVERRKLAAAYGIPAEKVDGNCVEEVAAAAERAAAHIRQGKGPYLLDIRTYRVEPHCGIITDNRDPEVARMWKEERDALRGLKERHPDVLTPEVISKIDAEVAARLDSAVAAALEAPEPDLNQFRKTFGV